MQVESSNIITDDLLPVLPVIFPNSGRIQSHS